MNRRNALLLLWGGLLGASPLPAWGADPAAPLDDHAKAINRAAATPEGSQRVVEHLSKELQGQARGAGSAGRGGGHGGGKGK